MYKNRKSHYGNMKNVVEDHIYKIYYIGILEIFISKFRKILAEIFY
jgi:hypothetical protein